VTADILPFIRGCVFDEAATEAMGLAYDKARRMLHDKGQPGIVQEIIAKRIIDIAIAGERDPDELARRALLALGMKAE
jgi:hypothetical protein